MASWLRLFLRNLEPFTSPDALHSLQADGPAILLKRVVDARASISPEARNQPDDRLRQDILVSPASGRFALCRTMVAEHRAGATLGGFQSLNNMIDTAMAA